MNSQINRIALVVERSEDGYFGRVNYVDDLLVDSAETVNELIEKMKVLLNDFHDVDISKFTFEIAYNLTALFEKFDYLKVSNIARIAGINSSLLRQYATGVKNPSASQAKKIEDAIHTIGRELINVSVFSKAR